MKRKTIYDYSKTGQLEKIFAFLKRDKSTKKKSLDCGTRWGEMSDKNANCELYVTNDSVIVIDVDGKDIENIGCPSLSEILSHKTPNTRTSRGSHYIFALPEGKKYSSATNIFKVSQNSVPVDVKSGNSLAVFRYWGNDKSITYNAVTDEIAPAPQELLDILDNAPAYIGKNKLQTVNGDDKAIEGDLTIRVGDHATTLTTDDYRLIMQYIPPNEDYEEWLKITFASVHFAKECGNIDEVKAIWDEWSKRGNGYDEVQNLRHWNYAYKNNHDNPITVRTLIKMAREKGMTERLSDTVGWFPDWYTTDKGRIRLHSTVDNLRFLIEQVMEIRSHYDVILKKSFANGSPINHNHDHAENLLFSKVQSEAAKASLPASCVTDHYNAVMVSTPINPLVNMCMTTKWDGIDRLKQYIDTFCVDVDFHDEYFIHEGLKRWLIQCVAAWDYNVNCPIEKALNKYELVWVLQSAQGVKKTSAISMLLPEAFSQYIKTGVQLDTKNKDSVKTAISYGIVELGEMDATFKKSDQADFKAFMSHSHDEMREAYARKNSKFQRRTSFCASVNNIDFLKDRTGNRRIFAMPITAINDQSDIDRYQLWAQVWELYINGEQWWFDEGDEWIEMQSEKNTRMTDEGLTGEIADAIHRAISSNPKIELRSKRLGEIVRDFLGDKTFSDPQRSNLGESLRRRGIMYHQSSKKYSVPSVADTDFWDFHHDIML